MRKTFPLADPPHKPPQVVAAIKNKVRKYLKRERRKALPEGVDFWDFDCRVGQQGPPPPAAQGAEERPKEAATGVQEAEVTESTKVVHVAELIGAIDAAAKNGWATIYIEILAKHGKRTRKPRPQAEQSEPNGSELSESDPAVSDSAASDSAGSDSAASDSAASDSAGSDSAGSDSAASDSAGSDSAGSDSADSEASSADSEAVGAPKEE